MKKVLAALLALAIMLSIVPSLAEEGQAKDNSAAFGVDMVIVLDMTNSMKMNKNGTITGNDIYNYRSDAAAMLIGMLDMEHSRVAIVPFAGSPISKKTANGKDISELRLVDTHEIRQELVDAIYDIPLKPQTNIGAALMKANQILDSRDEKSNLPAIVLLTDGNNDMESNGQDYAYVNPSWRWENEQIVNKGNESYNTNTAVAVTREAVACAKELEIPIYTVELEDSKSNQKAGGLSLTAISQGTGLENGSWHVAKNNAKDLPIFFARVLADKIGSSVQNRATPEPVPGTANTYQVKIPILNKSVMETNIIIPTRSKKTNNGDISKIDPGSIKILNPEGDEQSEYAGASVLCESRQGHFALVKISGKRKPGMWTLQFNSDGDPGDVSFNILYNYDIKLAASLPDGGKEQREFYKNQEITLQAQFVDGNGEPSDDEALYEDISDMPGYEDWMQIRVTWELFKLKDSGKPEAEPVQSGKIQPKKAQKYFRGKIDLAKNDPSLHGDYLLSVHAEGAGLDRSVSMVITLKNHPPIGQDVEKTIGVNSTAQGEEGTWTVAGTSGKLLDDNGTPIDFRTVVTDEDGDPITFSLEAVDDVEQAVQDMEYHAEDGTISYKTKLAPTGDRIQNGDAVYLLSFSDGDEGKDTIRIKLHIVSDVEELLKKYNPGITVEGTTAGSKDKFKKNTEMTVSVRLLDTDSGEPAGAELIGALGRKISITTPSGEEVVSNQEMSSEGDALVFRKDTGNHEATWNIAVKLDFFDEPVETTVYIPNEEAPLAATDEMLTLYCDGERVPGFLSGLLGTDTEESDPSLDICPADLFTDSDGDILEIGEPAFCDPSTGEKADAGKISLTETEQDGEKKHYRIGFSGETTSLFSYSFASDLKIVAKDGDNLEGVYTRRVVVVDLFNQMLTYLVIALAAILVIIIIILIVRQIRKPRFPMLEISIREDTSLYETDRGTLSPVKTPTNVNAVGVDVDLAAKHGISLDLLQHIIIYPVQSRNAVGVVEKKPIPGHEVTLNDVELKPKKKTIWHVGEELSISSKNGQGLVALKLEEPSDDMAESDPTGGFGDEDDWASAGEPEVTTSTGRKFSRKVQRSSKPTEEETSTGDGDDFDF